MAKHGTFRIGCDGAERRCIRRETRAQTEARIWDHGKTVVSSIMHDGGRSYILLCVNRAQNEDPAADDNVVPGPAGQQDVFYRYYVRDDDLALMLKGLSGLLKNLSAEATAAETANRCEQALTEQGIETTKPWPLSRLEQKIEAVADALHLEDPDLYARAIMRKLRRAFPQKLYPVDAVRLATASTIEVCHAGGGAPEKLEFRYHGIVVVEVTVVAGVCTLHDLTDVRRPLVELTPTAVLEHAWRVMVENFSE